MPATISLGDARNKTVATVTRDGVAARLYHVEVPLLVNGVERTFFDLNLFVPDDMTNAELAAWAAPGLSVTWFASRSG